MAESPYPRNVRRTLTLALTDERWPLNLAQGYKALAICSPREVMSHGTEDRVSRGRVFPPSTRSASRAAEGKEQRRDHRILWRLRKKAAWPNPAFDQTREQRLAPVSYGKNGVSVTLAAVRRGGHRELDAAFSHRAVSPARSAERVPTRVPGELKAIGPRERRAMQGSGEKQGQSAMALS